MSQPQYADLPLYIRIPLYAFTAAALALLIVPLAVALPISLNAQPWFSYPFSGLSMRWFEQLLASPMWQAAIINSILIAVVTTFVSTSIGTLAAIGLVNPRFPLRNGVMALAISPMVVPVVVLGLGLFIFFSSLGLNYTFVGIVIAHTMLATPFVVITVTATLTRFDFRLMRAAASLGAGKITAFRTVMLPIIAPGVAAGAVFAFAASFDEVIMVLFVAGPQQRTLPKQMFTGLREQLDPTIIAAAVLMILLTTFLMLAALRLNKK
ncbi:ABC transporter permease [Phyllobacterium zundukense]|uniref:Polyamine ABC transporter permease n=1 Tax=Phyllobacterium zundukense TaxID=1867719 RepID=A0A2N9W0M9_9HYPH|nr:ABC transporter permease [Phyllobacterium zundukense]ATU95456.1 polyamine ABC transporter permease [Phyllobacterium zundukense]PIO45297.1 polyamine ABC transporter permease [Phyllobacterium zundukense]